MCPQRHRQLPVADDVERRLGPARPQPGHCFQQVRMALLLGQRRDDQQAQRTGRARAVRRGPEQRRVDDVRNDPVAAALFQRDQLPPQVVGHRADELRVAEAEARELSIDTAHQPALERRSCSLTTTGQPSRRVSTTAGKLALKTCAWISCGRHPVRSMPRSTALIPSSCVAIAAARTRGRRYASRTVRTGSPGSSHWRTSAPTRHRLGLERQHANVVAQCRGARLLAAERAEHGALRPRIPLWHDQDACRAHGDRRASIGRERLARLAAAGMGVGIAPPRVCGCRHTACRSIAMRPSTP